MVVETVGTKRWGTDPVDDQGHRLLRPAGVGGDRGRRRRRTGVTGATVHRTACRRALSEHSGGGVRRRSLLAGYTVPHE